ncbi:MAG TPA: DUF1036 domain-containing protein [Synergistaceae bacterium]|nr:DUF1036 domain-containing protein [Synergistaceae bacterium]HPJ26271.1 DUF1036 domain-containing protein [Synergistaceae bacterium]HPQ38085.1 DUF1036 domain-containing protein [Synergistaceae bacterium]
MAEKNMKKVSTLWLALLILGLSLFTRLPQAEAVKVILDNHRDQKITASLIYYDLNQSSWCCQGWWGVDPLDERTIQVPHDPNKRIYYYIESGGKVVHGRSEGWARWDVINNAFKYYEHDGCPDGKKYRSVYFNCSQNVTGGSWELNVK